MVEAVETAEASMVSPSKQVFFVYGRSLLLLTELMSGGSGYAVMMPAHSVSALTAWPGLPRRDRGFWRRRAIFRWRPRTVCDYTGRARAKPQAAVTPRYGQP